MLIAHDDKYYFNICMSSNIQKAYLKSTDPECLCMRPGKAQAGLSLFCALTSFRWFYELHTLKSFFQNKYKQNVAKF